MKTIKTKPFVKWANKNDVSDQALFNAAMEIIKGGYEADYGGGIIKKRIATKGRGKSSSARTIVAFKVESHCFFLYGFEKSKKSNISSNEEKAIKLIAKTLFAYSELEIAQLIKDGVLIEVHNE